MIIKSLEDAAAVMAGDASLLKELFHPAKGPAGLGFSLAHAEIGPGEKTLPHRLKSAEVYYVLEGRGLMHVGTERAEIGPAQAVYIAPGEIQFIENRGPGRLAFLCIVQPAWAAGDEEVL